MNTQTTEPRGKNSNLKLTIIASLIALTIILFYIFISSGSDDENSTELNSVNKPVSKEVLSKDIDSILFTFGINKEWIKEVTVKENTSGGKNSTGMISKEVKIPADLLSIELNYELTNYFRAHGIKEKVTEDPKTKNMTVNFFTEGDSVYKANGKLNFIYSDTLRRNAAEVCLILDSIDYYPLSEIRNILDSPEKFSVFLPMRNDKADYQSAVQDSKKDYLIEFTAGGENDVAADFKSDMPEKIWKAKVKSAALNNSAASGIIILIDSGQMEFLKLISDEFIKNNMNVYKDTVFTFFKSGDLKTERLFENIVSNTAAGKKYLIYSLNFSPAEFKEYESKVSQMKKLGYKFTDFRSIIKSQSKNN